MKQKSQRLKDKIADLATKNDLKKVEKSLRAELHSTEKSLRAELHSTEKSLRAELLRLEGKMGSMEERIDENARGYRDEVLTKLDGVMGELATMREENAVGAYQTRELKERVEQLEKSHLT